MKRLITIFLVFSSCAQAGDIATERTQVVTAALLQYITQVNTEIEKFTKEIENFESKAALRLEPESLQEIDALDNVFAIYRDIEAMIQQGNALAHTAANTEQWFTEQYDDYDGFYDALAQRGSIDREPVQDRLNQWNNTHRSTIMNTMKAHGVQADMLQTSEQRLSLLQDKSRTAEGRMQAMQVGQELATEEIKQLHGLKEILMEQSNLHSSYFAYSAATKADQEAHSEYFHEDVMPTIIGNEVGAKLP